MLSPGLIKIPKKELPILAREEAKKHLMVVPSDTLDPIYLWEEDSQYLAVPRGYFGYLKKRFDPNYDFDFALGSDVVPVGPIEFKPGQEEIVEKCLEVLRASSFSGVILESKVASGKTAMTLEIADRLISKTLVIVHTTVLMKQWQKEIKKFKPNWSSGIIHENICDIEGNDICVGMLHSLSMKDYPPEFYREFGTIIIDEVDRVACEEFHKIFKRFPARHIIGTTGTLKRTDGAESLVKHCIGPVVSAMSTIKSLDPIVYFIDTRFLWRPGSDIKNEIVHNEDRNELIVSNASKAAESGRHVLILANRVVHAENIYRKLVNRLIKKNISVGLMIGPMPQGQRELHQTAQVQVATTQLLSVGYNNPRLDTLIFANPMEETTQAIGRILREHPDKKQPMVIDIVDSQNIPAFRAAKRRKDEYGKKGWELVGDRFLG